MQRYSSCLCVIQLHGGISMAGWGCHLVTAVLSPVKWLGFAVRALLLMLSFAAVLVWLLVPALA